MEEFYEAVVVSLYRVVGEVLTQAEIQARLQPPPDPTWGDLGFPVSAVSKNQHLKPEQLVSQLAVQLEPDGLITKIEARGDYVNFFANETWLIPRILTAVLTQTDSYGASQVGQGETVVIEFSDPNIGKPMHIGHIRSTILGDSLRRIYKFCGYHCVAINYPGDIGLHIGKLLVAIEEWGDETKIAENPERELLDLYVRFNCLQQEAVAADVSPEEEEKQFNYLDHWTVRAKDMLRRLEQGEPSVVALWQKIQAWSFTAFERIYSLLKVDFDEVTGQSQFIQSGKALVAEALAKGIAEKQNGAVVVPLEAEGLPAKVILRSDGTALYSTQDLGAAVYRYDKYHFVKSLYVVGSEQAVYFAQLFAILAKLGFAWSKDCLYIPFGLLRLGTGKLSTRAGRVVFLEEVLQKAISLAEEIIAEKNPQLTNRSTVAEIVGIGAVKYAILSVDRERDIQFSWDRTLSFDGKAAPYILYAYARAASILRKVSPSDYKQVQPEHFTQPTERFLAKKLGFFPVAVKQALATHQPSVIAAYAYELAVAFSNFYEQIRVLDNSDQMSSRLALVASFSLTLKNALSLLGIEVVEEM